MEVSSDPYEQKLFQMFRSCDSNHSGALDENALSKLCEMLELQDHKSVIMKSLIKTPRSRVSFGDFKEALLNFLGTEIDGSLPPGERTLILNDESDSRKHVESPQESSDREVSPKFVVGAKKYGRRSRPQFIGSDSSPSESDQENLTKNSNSNNVQRSSSQSDILSSHRRRPICAGAKLKRCASLPAQKNQRVRDAILEKTKAAKAATKINSSAESLELPPELETVPAQAVIEMWERANINSAKGLLLSLGFDEDELNISQLTKVLEEELRGLVGETQTTLLKASLALQASELATFKQAFFHLNDENKKLHADNKDANRRAAMLAQEIDERHTTLEEAAKEKIRLLEQRHAEVVRDLTARMANDRENWSNLTARLESRIKTLEQEELKLRSDTESLRQENSALENEQTQLQKQITELLETNIQLNKEIADVEEKNRHNEGSKSEKETEEMLELIEKITSLQVENANLRDKNDELVAEVEGLNFEISRCKAKRSPKVPLTTDDDPDHASAAVKRRGDSPSKTRITEESPRLGKFRRCNADTNSESDTSGDWMALNSELKNPMNVTSAPSTSSGFSQESSSLLLDSKDQEIASLKTKISQLENELKSFKSNEPQSESMSTADYLSIKSEKEALEVRCKELETSLEQMQKAYEECEDYWQDKLSEERQMFEKERKIYEEEQKESDIKFTELVEKVREYEEQFSKDGRLSPIEEKDVLEQQYADLEAEAEQIRENARQIFEEKSKEIESLQSEIEDLRMKLGESVEILTGANEMQGEMSELESPASSPISYLWHQSTIQSPVTQYKVNSQQKSPTSQRNRLNNLSTSETTVFSTTQPCTTTVIASDESKNISPIQRPHTPKVAAIELSKDCEDSSSTASAKSFETQSVASTHSIQKSSAHNSSTCSSPNIVKEELKRLKYFELQLKDQVKDLALQRDGLVMELQQLQEAKPVLEKAYARAAHPTLIQRVNHLELKNRHLQNVIKQQHQYTESLMQQTWQQQHVELADLRNRLETQSIIMTEQTQRLAAADMVVKDLYVENAHLSANVQNLEQKLCRVNMLQQHQSLSGLPGMP